VKKLKKLLSNHQVKLDVALKRFDEHMECFDFRKDFNQHGNLISEDMETLINLVSLNNTTVNNSSITEKSFIQENNSNIDKNNVAVEIEGRLEGKYVSNNVLNLSKRVLSSAEISLLSKGLKFVPTPKFVDRAVLKQDLETFGRKLRLAWHFRNDQRTFDRNPFRQKSKFDPKGKDAAIELYLSRLEEEILEINTYLKYSNITKEER